MKKIALGLLIIGFFFVYITRNSDKPASVAFSDETNLGSNSANYKKQKANFSSDTKVEPKEAELSTANSHFTNSANTVQPIQRRLNPVDSTAAVLTYVIDDGMAVIQGDIIIGEVPRNTLLKNLSGSVNEPGLQIWPTTEIPFFIQPNLPNPDRVLQALAFFSGTNIHFVPYTNQEDAIVFELGMSNCKSYLGYIGGHQKIMLSGGCGPKEIAHEIMHSLGFLHEQNRTDRDNYVDVLWDNINPKFKMNFEKFSSKMMIVSGLSAFDFESIMIYPETMFSINDQPTMKSKLVGQPVSPKDGPSSKDIERINKTY